jgi:hypothetical protein
MSQRPRTSEGRGAVPLALGFAAVVAAVVAVLWWRGELPRVDEPAVEPPEVTTPRHVGDFTLDRSEPARAFKRDVERQLSAQSEGSQVTVGTYGGPAGQVVMVGTVFGAESDQGTSLAADPGDAVRDYLSEVGLEDLRAAGTGDHGGVLVCGHEPDAGPVSCAWGDESGVLVTLRFATGDLATASVREAAAETRTFLDAVLAPVG